MVCVVLKDFSDLLSIAFGVNLALPLFRELVLLNRRSVVTRIPILQSIIETRNYEDVALKHAHFSAITKAKVDLVSYDKKLNEEINICSVIAFLFAIASLLWIYIGIYNPSCLSSWMVFIAVWLNFIPLPVSVGFLWFRSRELITNIKCDLDDLMEHIM